MAVSIAPGARRRKFVPNEWLGIPAPASIEAADPILREFGKSLRDHPETFEKRARDFYDWAIEIPDHIILRSDIRSILVYGANKDPDRLALVDDLFPRPARAQLNGAHHPAASSAPTTAAPNRFGAFYEGEGDSAPVPSIIKGLLPRDGVCVLGGQSGAGKSYLAVHLAICLATGAPFFGYRTRHKSAILYAAAEGGATIQPRINAAKKLAGITERLPIKIFTRLRFPGADEKPREEGKLPPLEEYIGALKIEIAELRERTGIEHVTMQIDTTMAAFEIRDENSAAEIAGICHRARRIAEECGALVILVHHFGKDATRGLRGSSAWRDNVDHGFFLLADRDEATNEVKKRNLNFLKNRVGKEGPIAGFKLETMNMGVDEDGEPWEEAAVAQVDYEVIAPAAAKQKKKPRDVAFDQAFAWAIANGEPKRVRGDGPLMRMVRVALVKDQFSISYGTGEDGKERREPTVRKGFSLALQTVRKDPKYAFHTIGGTEWVYRTDQDAVNAFEKPIVHTDFDDIPI